MLVRVRRSNDRSNDRSIDRCKSFEPCHDYLGFGAVSQPFHVLGVGTHTQIISLPLILKLFPNLTEFKVTDKVHHSSSSSPLLLGRVGHKHKLMKTAQTNL
jgi:hypothetical protein